MITLTRNVSLARSTKGRRRVAPETLPNQPATPCRIPRVARLMALAIKYDHLLRTRQAAGFSELARRSHVTQPRMSQIMALNNLAPDIQEAILYLPPATSGRDPIHEKLLRPLTAQIDWQQQRNVWKQLVSTTAGGEGPEC